MNIRKEVLSVEELNSIKKELRSAYFTALISLLITLVLAHLYIIIVTGSWIVKNYETILILGIALIIWALTKYFTKDIKNELQSGDKIVTLKLIEKKHEYLDKQDRFSSEYTKYVIVAEGEEFEVNKEEYQKAEQQDFLAIHKTGIREKIITFEIEKKHLPLTLP